MFLSFTEYINQRWYNNPNEKKVVSSVWPDIITGQILNWQRTALCQELYCSEWTKPLVPLIVFMTSYYVTFRWQFSPSGVADDCFTNPVGISDQSKIPDNRLTASSHYDDSCQPAYGRLNGTRGDGWCSKESTRYDDWLQVDLGITVKICAAATQGDINANEWTTAFKLSYSTDGNIWKTYRDSNGTEKVSIYVL